MRDFQLKQKFIIAGLTILLLADGALFYFNSQLSSPQENRQQLLSAQTRQLALVRADVRRGAEIRAKIPQTLKEFDQFEATLLPASSGYSVLTQEMDEFARASHLIVDHRSFHPKEEKERNLTELTVESSVTGDYNGIVTFLNRLQRSKNVYIVDTLAVDSEVSGQGPVGALRVTLHMRTYLRKA
ncbi:MAG: type 4a pilus biogenesis protein PilO [Candidatus Acidiferrum sp.]